MFMRNDKGDFRRYFNGKIGTISELKKRIFINISKETAENRSEKRDLEEYQLQAEQGKAELKKKKSVHSHDFRFVISLGHYYTQKPGANI